MVTATDSPSEPLLELTGVSRCPSSHVLARVRLTELFSSFRAAQPRHGPCRRHCRKPVAGCRAQVGGEGS